MLASPATQLLHKNTLESLKCRMSHLMTTTSRDSSRTCLSRSKAAHGSGVATRSRPYSALRSQQVPGAALLPGQRVTAQQACKVPACQAMPGTVTRSGGVSNEVHPRCSIMRTVVQWEKHQQGTSTDTQGTHVPPFVGIRCWQNERAGCCPCIVPVREYAAPQCLTPSARSLAHCNLPRDSTATCQQP